MIAQIARYRMIRLPDAPDGRRRFIIGRRIAFWLYLAKGCAASAMLAEIIWAHFR